MAGFKDIAAAKRKRKAAMDRALGKAKAARTGGSTPEPTRRSNKVKRTVRHMAPSKVNKVQSVSKDNTSAIDELERRIQELTRSGTTRDR